MIFFSNRINETVFVKLLSGLGITSCVNLTITFDHIASYFHHMFVLSIN